MAIGGYYNGHILLQTLDESSDENKPKVKTTTIIATSQSSPIMQIAIDNVENFAVCGNSVGTVFVYIINQKNKTEWTLYKTLYDHQSEITYIVINENLNIFMSFSKDGYCMLYSIPELHLINSFRITDKSFSIKDEDKNSDSIDNNNNKIIYYPKVAIISSSPLPCMILYIEARKSLSLFSINGQFLREEKLDFELNKNFIKKYTDMQFIDYLLIYNLKNNCIDVYNILELKPVLILPEIGHTLVDFTFGKKLDHILLLVQYKGKNIEKNSNDSSNYKILILKNPNCEIDWK
jgi:hypothetical protein